MLWEMDDIVCVISDLDMDGLDLPKRLSRLLIGKKNSTDVLHTAIPRSLGNSLTKLFNKWKDTECGKEQ